MNKQGEIKENKNKNRCIIDSTHAKNIKYSITPEIQAYFNLYNVSIDSKICQNCINRFNRFSKKVSETDT